MKILLVDNELQLFQLIYHQLKRENYVVEIAQSGQYALDLIQQDVYDLILLDVELPDVSGIELCKVLRTQDIRTPILILTGKDQVQDKVAGLDAGADDYLVKPFAIEELAARVRALIRRDSDVTTPLLTHGDLTFDSITRNLSYQGKMIQLRPKELGIAELMLRYPTQIFAPDTLLDRLWPLADCPSKATIKAHILSLRKQLKAVGAPDMIETLYGQGYRLNPMYSLAENQRNSAPLAGKQTLPSQPTSSPKLIHQTWQQLQTLTWERFTELETTLTAKPNPQNFTKARELAQQLQAVLGKLFLEQASIYTASNEEQRRDTDSQNIQILEPSKEEIVELSQNLQQRAKRPPQKPQTVPTDEIQVLAVLHDAEWGKQLWDKGHDYPFHINISHPLKLTHLLAETTPQVILLELDSAQPRMNSILLKFFKRHYHHSASIVTAINENETKLANIAIQAGITAIVSKSWSFKTILNVITEYTGGCN